MNYQRTAYRRFIFTDRPELWFLQRLFAYHRSSRI